VAPVIVPPASNQAEAARVAEESRKAEEARKAAEAARQAETARLAEAARLAQEQPPQPAAPPRGSYTVQQGDSLWTISARPQIFNDPYNWPTLYLTNRERLVDPGNPHLIEPGQVLQIPELGNARFYAVKAGDDLTSIASNPEVYNDPNQWIRLYEANRNRLPNPENPHLLYPGLVLEIPRP
jgi:nucleoid-associated protein YgaU